MAFSSYYQRDEKTVEYNFYEPKTKLNIRKNPYFIHLKCNISNLWTNDSAFPTVAIIIDVCNGLAFLLKWNVDLFSTHLGKNARNVATIIMWIFQQTCAAKCNGAATRMPYSQNKNMLSRPWCYHIPIRALKTSVKRLQVKDYTPMVSL